MRRDATVNVASYNDSALWNEGRSLFKLNTENWQRASRDHLVAGKISALILYRNSDSTIEHRYPLVGAVVGQKLYCRHEYLCVLTSRSV